MVTRPLVVLLLFGVLLGLLSAPLHATSVTDADVLMPTAGDSPKEKGLVCLGIIFGLAPREIRRRFVTDSSSRSPKTYLFAACRKRHLYTHP